MEGVASNYENRLIKRGQNKWIKGAKNRKKRTHGVIRQRIATLFLLKISFSYT